MAILTDVLILTEKQTVMSSQKWDDTDCVPMDKGHATAALTDVLL